MKLAIIDIIGIPYDGTTVFKHGLGGSESAVTFASRELAQLGFDVTVFNNCNIDHAKPGVYDNVVYRPLTDLALDHDFDVVISSRTVIPFTPPERYPELRDGRAMPFQSYNLYDRILAKAKMRILWMHDTFCLGDLLIEELAVKNRITNIFTLSDFHLTYVANCDHGKRRNFEVLKPKMFITRNGAYNHKPVVDIAKKDKNLFVYNASVTKGMIPLVHNVWPIVKHHIPDAKLKVIGGFYRFSENSEPDQQEKDWRNMVADPTHAARGIEFTGVIPQSEIAEILSEANFMIYPTAFPETFGISTLESLLYNTPTITCRFGALEEIAADMASYKLDYSVEPNGLFPNINMPEQVKKFAQLAIDAYNNPYLHQQKQYYCNNIKDIAGWDTVMLQWKQFIYKETGSYLSRDDYRRVSYINNKIHKIFNRRYTNAVEFPVYRAGTEQPIVVVSTMYNNEQYVAKCIESVATQDYNNYVHLLIDDASTDSTFEVIQETIKGLPDSIRDKFYAIRNPVNLGAVKNQVQAIRDISDPESIIMVLDGDDWLVNDNNIFANYNAIYDGSTEFTYGSCWSVVDNIPLISQPYPEHIKQARAYRQHKFNWIMPYTHLRTFKQRLIRELPDSVFKDASGQWFKAGGDGATFYNIIEQADPNKVKCLQDVVYNYNDASPTNDYKVNGDEQNRTARYIVNQKPVTKKPGYSVVVPTMWKANDIFLPFLDQLIASDQVDEIFLFDNAPDQTPELPVDSKLTVINVGKNQFVNPTWNQGVDMSSNERICIMNDDVAFDLKLFDVLYDRLTAEEGVFGLNPGEPDFNQIPVSTKTIDIVPWTPGNHTYGFGCLMFINKASWLKIPEGLDIYFGDNYIFDMMLRQGKTNYFIANMDFTTPFATTTSDTSITDGFLERERSIYEKIMNTPTNFILTEFVNACRTESDINHHLPTLKALADECETVIEFGVRTGVSTRALVASTAKKIDSYDIVLDNNVIDYFRKAQAVGRDCSYTQGNSLELEIPEVDMLFIDTDHEYEQLSAELARHHSKVKKYIAFHDTFTYGLHKQKGLLSAIIEFMQLHPEWKFKHYTTENNGLTVIERVGQATKAKPANKKILIAVPTNKYIEPETMQAIYDLEVPEGYTTHFQYFYGYQIDQIRNLIADWAKNYDYLFSVDSDIAFPKNTLKKLLAHDVDMVSGLYRQRKDQQILEIYRNGVSVPYSELKGRGLVEVQSAGFGCLLVKSAVIRAMDYPHFVYKSAIDHKNTVSEDTYFCIKAKEKGFKVFADTSILCDHHGARVFRIEDATPATTATKSRLQQLSEQLLMPEQHVAFLRRLGEIGYTPKVVYDIGACVLHWTKQAQQVWPTAKVIAFEGMDEAEEVIKQGGVDYNIGLLSNEDNKILNFYQNIDHPGGNSYYRENEKFSPKASELYTDAQMRRKVAMTLDTVVEQRKFPLPDFVKIDVQGAELDILKGASRVLEHAQHVILELQVIEYNKGAPLRDEVIAFMDQKGFDCFGIFCNNGPDGDYHFVKRAK